MRFEVFIVSGAEAAVAVAVGSQKRLGHFVLEVLEFVLRSESHLIIERVKIGLEGSDKIISLKKSRTHPIFNVRDCGFVFRLFSSPVPNRY